ncbi:MFS transporter [Cellulomonas sp. P5_E12]
MTAVPESPVLDDPTTPTVRVRARWIIAFSLAVVGVAAGWFGPIQILLPAQAARLEDLGLGGKEAILAIVTATGAVVSMIANPLWGGISDRTRSRWGRRRPTIVAGTAVGVVGLVVLGSGDTLPVMIGGWVAIQIGLNGPFAALAATIADRVPPDQRGLVGALFGIAQTVGVVLGTAIAVVAGEGRLGYYAIAIAVPALVVAFLLVHREPSTRTSDAPTPQRAALAFWRGLRPTRLFVWAWTIRFLVNLVNALVLLYLYFYLSDEVGESDPGSWVLVVTLLVVVVAAATAGVAGTLSDRWGRRVPFIVAATVVLAAGSVLLAVVPELPVVLGAAGLVGIGWGLYISVDLAVLTAGMPSGETHGAMLGIGNVASALPQALAPVVAAPIVLHLGGYTGLYLVAAVVCVAALLCVPGLRGIR